jgi:DNA-directed RNA polymerase subunit beta
MTCNWYSALEEEGQYVIAQATPPSTRTASSSDDNLVPPAQRRLRDVSPETSADGRRAEPAGLGGRVAHPVPRARRRQPRAHGLEHAAPGRAALRTEAPLVGTGMEGRRPRLRRVRGRQARRRRRERRRDAHRRQGRQRTRSPARSPTSTTSQVPALQPEHLHQPEADRPRRRPRPTKGDVIADGPATGYRRAGARPERGRRVHALGGYNFEDSILISERIVKEDVFTSIHIEEFECVARDTKLGKEEITRDIPNVGEEALKDLDESGIVRIGAEVKPGDILVGKITPKGETQLSPEEKLLRAIFGEKAGDVRDTSLRVPPGVSGIVISAKVFSRKGIDKDERAQDIEDAERQARRTERRDQDPPRLRSTEDPRAPHRPDDQPQARRRQGQGAAPEGQTSPSRGARPRPAQVLGRDRGREVDGVPEARGPASSDARGPRPAIEEHFQDKIDKLKKGDELPPGVIKMVKVYVAIKRKLQVGDKMAGRHGNKGVVSRILPEEDMPYLSRRHAGRHRAQPARRAEPHERRPDPRGPPRLGRPELGRQIGDGREQVRHAALRACSSSIYKTSPLQSFVDKLSG